MSKQFKDLERGAGFWCRTRKWVKAGERSARSFPEGEFEVFLPSESVVESVTLTLRARIDAQKDRERLVDGICAQIAKMGEPDVDAHLSDLNRYPDPDDPESDRLLRLACFQRLEELQGDSAARRQRG